MYVTLISKMRKFSIIPAFPANASTILVEFLSAQNVEMVAGDYHFNYIITHQYIANITKLFG